jgi:hypothetical protein
MSGQMLLLTTRQGLLAFAAPLGSNSEGKTASKSSP